MKKTPSPEYYRVSWVDDRGQTGSRSGGIQLKLQAYFLEALGDGDKIFISLLRREPGGSWRILRHHVKC